MYIRVGQYSKMLSIATGIISVINKTILHQMLLSFLVATVYEAMSVHPSIGPSLVLLLFGLLGATCVAVFPLLLKSIPKGKWADGF